MTVTDTTINTHLELVQQICRALAEPDETLPTLADLSARFHMSPYHLQRVFKRIVGVTPRQYADACRMQRLKTHLQEGTPVTHALYEAGFASSSSLYDLAAAQLGMTPAVYQQGGLATQISYTIVPCELGFLLVGATERGICAVRLGDTPEALERDLTAEFASARLERNDSGMREWVEALLEYLRGEHPSLDLPLDVRATAFQRRVWEELRTIPYGETRSYGQIAAAIGQPTAARAVAQACAHNPVALVIPCHRVVREDGHLGGYRWGTARKQRLLVQEAHARQSEDLSDAQ